MFFQMKAIRKGSKPPVWRRAYLPSNITFAQLALILETILEYDESDLYEFEFYHKKDRIIEWHEGDQNLHDFYFSYLNAPDTYVNEWLFNEAWFTFRMRTTHVDVPEYRVEIEKILDKIEFQNGTEKKALSYPVILKEVSYKNDSYWSDGNIINETLRNRYVIGKADPGYMYISELRTHIANGQGISICDEMMNRDIHTQKSASATLKELTDQIISPYISQRVDELKKEIDIDEKTGKILSSEEEINKTTEKFVADMAVEMKQKIEHSISERAGISQLLNARKKASMEGMLNAYTKQDLCEIAEEIGRKLTATRKDKMAYELARYLLEPQTMREQLLQLDDSELAAFEKAMDKGHFVPSEEECQELAMSCDLNYMACFTDGSMEVPEEVILVYKVITQHGYREFHEKAYWLLLCLNAFACIHLVAPARILYRMYRQKIKSDYEEFLNVLEKIPDRLNSCKIVGDKMISKEILNDDLYQRIEARQRDVDYYVPTIKEIISYAEDGYPSCEEAYAELFGFYYKQMHVDDEKCEYLCLQAFRVFTTGGMISDYIDLVNEMNIIFDSDEQVEQFASLAMRVNNNTRMFELKGHKPLEMRESVSGFSKRKMPEIVPMSSSAAGILEFGKGKPETSIKKVYPNDPCPCGSGKKFKKCCGRK